MVLHRPRNGGSNTNPQSIPTPGVSNPNHPSPSLQTNPNFDVASLHPSTSQSQLSPPPAQPNSNPPSTNQSQPSLPPVQPDSNPPSTNQSQPSLPSAQPNSNPPSTNHFQPSLFPAQPNSNPPLLSQQSTSHQNPSQSQTSVTDSVIQPETSSGATSAASGVVGLVDLTLPTSEYGVIALDDVNDNELDRSYLASNPVNVDSACHLTGIHQWQKAGIVKEDKSSLGILNQNAQVPLNDMDRTQEVLSCEHVLMEAASTHEDILLPIFLTLTYEEMCHQARSDRRSMVIVILKGDNIPDVIRILNILRRSNGNTYFWITKENSKSGREVKRKFGSTGSDLLIMAPTTSQPILIERFCGDNLQLAREEDVVDAMKRAADAVDAFTREWERLEQERSLKREQEISLQKAIENDKTKLIKKSSKKIREARQGRVTQPSLEGEKVTIVLCHSNGKEKRQFNKGAFFQEVYDWAGSNECLPLYFTIQRGREVVRHGDLLERTEVLHIYERVTFQGNVPDLQSDGELSSTLPDEDRDTGNKNEKREM
ncbi:uncharacterized protein [Pocillopora verrucosa]|uniref:uncharacterized protein isoform X2 n=1 Tax=Pocillopora verrucosa TaxID=203993 RepID=UPI00334291BB